MAVGFITSAATEILASRINQNTYVCLSSTTPNKDGSNFVEPSETCGYSRRKIGTIDTSIGAQVANADIIFLFEAIADGGSATHLGLSTNGARGGGVFLVAALTSTLTIGSGYVPLIRAHKLVIGLDKDALEAY